MTNEPFLNRNHKDALFRFIFKNPKDLLSLYNALNDTDYTDVSDLTVTTLEDIVYMSYKNDISFILGSEMSLFEHQSTFNPNMPLRGLFYFSSLYKKYVAENSIDIYSSKRAEIPIPRYIIFYNGQREMPERCTLRLSDAFSYNSHNSCSKDSTSVGVSNNNINSSIDSIGTKFPPAIEITAHMININIGNNAELMEKCRLLHDYAAFIGVIRDYVLQENDINTAVTLAINHAISHNILKEVLSVHTAEVRDMILTEYNEEQHIKNEKNISYDDGFNDGVERGIEQGIERGLEQGIIQGRQIANIEAIKNMIKLNIPKDKILECYSEEEYNSALNNIND